jgi:hypothetical protein
VLPLERHGAIEGAAPADRRVAVHTVGAIDLEQRGADRESSGAILARPTEDPTGAVAERSRAGWSDAERPKELHQSIGE